MLIFQIINYDFLYYNSVGVFYARKRKNVRRVIAIKNNADIYWFYCPLKTTYFYFIAGIIVTTYIGEFIKYLKKFFTH